MDLEARRLIALQTSVPDFVLDESLLNILAAASGDGGWGFDGQASESTALETALALRALSRSARLIAGDLLRGVGRLAALQAGGGGFPRINGAAPDIGVTAEVLAALAALSQVTNVEGMRSRAVAFLLAARNADGGFPAFAGEASNVTTTALVMHALLEAGAASPILQQTRSFLAGAQASDGSWLQDVYTTALALQVVAGERADLALTAAAAIPVAVVQGQMVSVGFTVSNLGLTGSGATSIDLFAGDPSTGGTLLGSLPLAPLLPGVSTSGDFPIDTTALNGVINLYTVVDRTGVVPEYSEVNNRRVVFVDVRPVGSAPPAAGNQPPRVTSIPPSTGIQGVPYIYQVVANDPEGGPLQYAVELNPGGSTLAAVDANGLFTWLPFEPGRVHAWIAIRDAQGLRTMQHLVIDVIAPGEKRSPVFESHPIAAARPGILYRYQVQAVDPDEGPVMVSLARGPAGMLFDAGSLTVTWTPTSQDIGSHVVRLLATDDEFESTVQSFTVIVKALTDDSVDLVILAVDALVVSDPQSRTATGNVQVRVGNQGAAKVTGGKVSIFEDRDGVAGFAAGIDAVIGSAALPPLESAETALVQVAVTGTLLFRDNRVLAVVDPDGAIRETREDNNVMASGAEKRLLAVHGAFEPVLKMEWHGTDPSRQGQGGNPEHIIVSAHGGATFRRQRRWEDRRSGLPGVDLLRISPRRFAARTAESRRRASYRDRWKNRRHGFRFRTRWRLWRRHPSFSGDWRSQWRWNSGDCYCEPRKYPVGIHGARQSWTGCFQHCRAGRWVSERVRTFDCGPRR